MLKPIINIYDKHYKKLFIIPVIILILALAQIVFQTATTGDFVNKGISLKGGSTITVAKNIDPLELQDYLNQEFKGAEITVRSLTEAGTQIAVAVESGAQDPDEIAILLNTIKQKIDLKPDDYAIEIVGASLGSSFFKQTIIAVVIAFVLMGLVVFAYFRTLAPSLAVILAAFSDIVVTIAIFNLLGFNLSTAGIAAFLMLIGYSVDTDILLSSRVLKRKQGTIFERTLGAMKTGLTMTFTTLVAVILALIFAQSPIIKQIMIILLIGLIIDLINTWLQNAAILRYYLEKKKHKYHESS
ncbi:protein translocase subunit SecF [Candidatus Woesearchaeota archaeon]|nr:protein translocase subunit SecF [Candidatus Woesearchaeota archaeon]